MSPHGKRTPAAVTVMMDSAQANTYHNQLLYRYAKYMLCMHALSQAITQGKLDTNASIEMRVAGIQICAIALQFHACTSASTFSFEAEFKQDWNTAYLHKKTNGDIG